MHWVRREMAQDGQKQQHQANITNSTVVLNHDPRFWDAHPTLVSLEDSRPGTTSTGRRCFVSSKVRLQLLLLPSSVAMLGIPDENPRCGDEEVSRYIQIPDTSHSTHPQLLCR